MTEFQVLVVGPFGENESGGIAAVTRELLSAQTRDAKLSAVSTTRQNKPTIKSALLSVYKIILLRLSRNQGVKFVQFNLASRGSCLRKILLSIVAEGFGLRFVFVVHGGGFLDFLARQKRPYRSFILWRLRRSAGVASVSGVIARGLMLHYQSQITTVFTLANGFGSQSRELKVIQRQSNGKVKVLFVGADTSAKGFPLFVSLAEKYGGTNSNFNFVAAGGAKRSEASNVQQLGVISPNDLQLELESAALLVVPSRVEAMPMVILEAMKNRVPVLASPVGDIPEVLSFGSVGVLFDGSWESLDLSFQHFAANQSEFVRISERAYTKWQNEYTAEAMFNRHLNFWRQSTKRVRFKRAF